MNAKAEIRKYIKEKRNELKENFKKQMDLIIYKNVVNSDYYKSAKTIFIYVSYNNETDTHEIIARMLEDKKIVCVPKVLSLKEGMIAVKIESFDDLKPGLYGIPEPLNIQNAVKEGDIDTIFLPGVAFDLNGGRIGYGGGFYDRFLDKTKADAVKIALAYEFQIMNEVPMNDTDKNIDGIITEKEIHTIS